MLASEGSADMESAGEVQMTRLYRRDQSQGKRAQIESGMPELSPPQSHSSYFSVVPDRQTCLTDDARVHVQGSGRKSKERRRKLNENMDFPDQAERHHPFGNKKDGMRFEGLFFGDREMESQYMHMTFQTHMLRVRNVSAIVSRGGRKENLFSP